MIIDTHCHYNLDPLFENWQTHWQKAQEHGVKKAVIVGTDLESCQRALDIAKQDDNLFVAIGIHPNECEMNDFDVAKLEPFFAQETLQKIVAIGETGLDYFRLPDSPEDSQRQYSITNQQNAFRAHIQLSQKYKLPLIIHVRDKTEQAYWDVLKILRESRYSQKFILHCISGPLAYVQQAVEMGAYIGMAGNVTYKNSEHIRDIIRSVSPERLLLETDAPFLPPQEFRGKTCEPWMIAETAEFVEEELGIPAEACTHNASMLFHI